ncbi:MAG: ester cyclase [Nitriliruptorales bacterium]|nr:ester cyclase [Nitriliruptorales bacterium]
MTDSATQHKPAAELMREEFGYVAAKDLEGLLSLAHDDVTEDFIPLRTLRGKAQVRAFFEAQFAALPDQDFQVEDIHAVDANVAVGQWRIRGTFSGGSFEGIEPTGKPVDIRGIDVMRFEDGLLKHNTIYYDGLTFARQVGLLPAEESPADRAMLAAFNGLTSLKRTIKDAIDSRR